MAHQSYMKSVLEAALEIAANNGGRASAGDVSSKVFAQTRQEHKRVLNALSDLSRQGRLARLRQGVYGPMPATGKVLEKREIMKNTVNIKKHVTVEDLMEAAEVTKEYAREWLRMMTDNGALRKEQQPGMAAVWYRLQPLVGTVNNTAKANRLREIRSKQKKQITVKLNAIGSALGEIKTILESMDKEEA